MEGDTETYRTNEITLRPVRGDGVHAADFSTYIVHEALEKDDLALCSQDTRATIVESKTTGRYELEPFKILNLLTRLLNAPERRQRAERIVIGVHEESSAAKPQPQPHAAASVI